MFECSELNEFGITGREQIMSSDTPLIVPDGEEEEYEDEYYEEDGRSGCSGCGWGVAAAGCLIAVPLMIIAVAMFAGVATIGGVFDSIGDIFRNEPRQATVETTRTILTSIEAQAQLVTISADYSSTNVRVSIRDGFQNSCGFTASHSSEGTIQAGIDLSLVSAEDVTYNTLNETYTITLPPPHLISCNVDVVQYDRSFTVCNADWDGARLIAEYTATTGFRDESLESGILGRAEVEAYDTLVEFLGNVVNGATIEIVFAPYDPQGFNSTLPNSCQPEPPLGWTFDEVNNTWSN
jgi:hypothetical protein